MHCHRLLPKTGKPVIEGFEMSQLSDLQIQLGEALDRLRAAVTSKPVNGDTTALEGRIAALEHERAALNDELERLRDKRDKDVAALDELISQLKPLIEEV